MPNGIAVDLSVYSRRNLTGKGFWRLQASKVQ